MALDKNTVMKEAQKFVTKGQFDKAIAEWRKLLKESPNDANIFNTIGDLCLKKNAKAEAVDAYRRAADILAEDGFTSKAIALYKKVLNIDINQLEVHLALGDMNAEKGLVGNALENYKYVADHYKKANKTAAALGIYQKMADLNPSNLSFRIKLAEMYAKEGMKKEAIKAFLDASDVHIAKEAFQDARQMFEKALAMDPASREVYYKAGIVYFKEGKFGEACKALKPAFEGDPDNRELTDLYFNALVKAGKEEDAEQVIRKILAAQPERDDLSEKLCRILVAKNEHAQALEMASELVAARVDNGDRDGAEDILKRLIAADPHFSPARCKLADLYVTLGREQDAAATFVQTAEIMADEGDRDGAKAVLYRALEVVPDMGEAQELLDQLGAAATQQTPAQPPPFVEQPLAEPTPPAWEAAEEPASAGDPETVVPESEPFPEPVAEPETGSVTHLREEPAVEEAFAEIDVLIKYGLATKAVEQLEGLATRFPSSIQVRIRLRDLYGDLGQMDKAVGHMLVLADLYAARGQQDHAVEALQSAHQLDPSNEAVMSRLGMETSPPPEAPHFGEAAGEEPAEITSGFEPVGPGFDEAPGAFGDETAGFQEPPPTGEIAFEALDDGFTPLEEGFEEQELPSFDEGSPPFAEQTRTETENRSIAGGESEHTPAPPPSFLEQEERPVDREEPAGGDLNEIWAEAEFYYQQGLFDEAKKHYAKIIELEPGEKQAIARLNEIAREEEDTMEFSRLADAVEGLEGALPTESDEKELPMSASDEEAVRSLMSEIAQIRKPEEKAPRPAADRERLEPPTPPAKEKRTQPSLAASGKAKAGDDDFFDLGMELTADSRAGEPPAQDGSSNDFFDLASELRDELSGITEPSRGGAAAQEQSLDEIFEEFKRGVEQQSSTEDADTHYNLGVAYKEMGLLDDAIGEFSLTPEGEPKFVQSRHMLGLCYMEKGEYDSAISEIEYALTYAEAMGEDAQNLIGMHYDLGLAHQGSGQISRALQEFQRVQRMNPAYRDAKAKLKELKQGDFVSLDQIKDDIEKEVSAKFLEEGERIEREEKSRKSEKVGN